MKLIYIANIRLPTEKAHGLQIMKTCEALAKQGVEVELVVPRRLNRLKDAPFEFYGVKKKFKITVLWCLDLVSLNIFGAVGFWLESWTFYHAVKKYLHTQNRAVYYTRDLPIACWLSKDLSPIYYEIHTLPDRISFKYKETWDRCDGLVVISDGLKHGLTRHGIAAEKVLLARDAVDLQMFENLPNKINCRQKLNLQLDKKIVVYTGHLYEWKGTRILAEATRLLPKSSGIEIYIVGGTQDDVDIFKNKYGNIEHLHIVGWQNHKNIPLWLRAADILVIPTSAEEKRGAIYTSPMKLFEYMLAEQPIVVSDILSLREVLDDSSAFFFKSDDSVSLAATLEKVAADYFEARNKATKAYGLVIKKYSWEKRAGLIKNFIFNRHE